MKVRDIGVLAAVIMIIAMLIIPLPPSIALHQTRAGCGR